MGKSVFTCIDAHTCGNPVRVVKEGGPELHGSTMSEKRQHFLSLPLLDFHRYGHQYK